MKLRRSRLKVILVAAMALCSSWPVRSEPPAANPPPRALLIGCTKYDFNPERSLKGSGNDVALVSDLLVERFAFAPQNVRRLIEGLTAAERPTRANIVREIEALIREAKPRQQIVLYLAGHGSQQPDQNPPDPNDPEPDGLDELFLPADIGPWNDKIQSIRNAIIDDEFRAWTGQILAKGAELLVIFDSCHSGSGLRGIGDERLRRIEPEELIPASVLEAARNRVAQSKAQSPADEPALDPLEQGRWVALYAAAPHESTPEWDMPRKTPNARPHGLFTYTLCQSLRQSSVPSYLELIQRIRSQYMSYGLLAPTPLIEGSDSDRGVLGGTRRTPSFQLEQDTKRKWFVRAGQLHGLTEGAILAVREVNQTEDSAPLGHVLVTAAGLADSRVSPCRYKDVPKRDDLPPGGLCRLVYVEYGDLRLQVALDLDAIRDPNAKRQHTAIQELAARENSPFSLVDDPNAAAWFISNGAVDAKPDSWVLSPRSTAVRSRGLAAAVVESSVRLAIDADPIKLEETLRRISRATNLIGLASRLGNDDTPKSLNLKLELLYRSVGQGKELKAVSADRPTTFSAGGKLQFRLTNHSHEAADFTLLFVDSAFGIESIFPRQYGSDNRLPAGKSWETKPMTVTAETLGREHVVLIAVPAGKLPVNFAFLAQPNLAAAQAAGQQTRGGPATPFENFLQFAAFQAGSVRGMDISSGQTSPAVLVRSWVVQP